MTSRLEMFSGFGAVRALMRTSGLKWFLRAG